MSERYLVADQPRLDLRGGRPWVKGVPARLSGRIYGMLHQLMPRGGIEPMPAITIPLSWAMPPRLSSVPR